MKKHYLITIMLSLALLVSSQLLATDYLVSGAGTTAANGTYVETGTYNGKPYYEGPNSYKMFLHSYYGVQYYWVIHYTTSITNIPYWTYGVSSSADTPPLTGWSTGWFGSSPAPTLSISFLSYDTEVFVETTANDGTISNTLTITYLEPGDDYFTGDNGTFSTDKYTPSNVPSGLTMVITKNSNTELSVSLTGTATSHTHSDDVSDLGISFNNNAFYEGNASAVVNSTKSDLAIDYYFEIGSLSDLQTLSETSSLWDGAILQTADIDASATSGWNSGAGFSPIGNNTTEFTGIYNGQSYDITNLFIDRDASDYIGLFGVIEGARISNINLVSVNITGKDYTGGLAGQIRYASSDVNDCSVSGSVTGQAQTGGFAGDIYMDVTINNCSVNVSTSGTSSVGGFTGRHWRDSYLYARPEIRNSYATGGVTGSSRNIGGFVGWNTGLISESYAIGSVHGSSATESRIGGFVGGNANFSGSIGEIENCYCTGNVSTDGDNLLDTHGIGGFVGTYYNGGVIIRSYSTGSVPEVGTNYGGFCGRQSTGTSTDNFFDKTTAGVDTDPFGVLGKTTAEMKTQSTFTNWDFTPGTGDWEIQSGNYISYPYLQAITYDPLGTTPPVNPIPGLEGPSYYSGGSGTVGDPYQIATTEDIIELSNTSDDWGAYFIQTANIDFGENEQAVDWDGDGTASWDAEDQNGFSPIGNSTTKFTGSYDGDEKTISNLFVDRGTANDIALFGYLNGATIADLALTGIDITGNLRVGGLAGQDEGATAISGCTINGSTTIDGVTFVGGFIGLSNTSGSISDCHFSGTITADNTNGNLSTGGFVGEKGGTGTISECSTSGTINGNGRGQGGFVGWIDNGQIRRCYATMAVINTSTTQGRIGGFAGALAYLSTSGQIYNCYAIGSVTANSTSNTSSYGIGGFLGSYFDTNNNKVYNSYSTGAVSATSASAYVGGFSGEAYTGSGGANNCFWDITTSGQSSSAESGDGETGKTTGEMKTQATFSGWDFTVGTGIWEIKSGTTSSYPYLAAVPQIPAPGEVDNYLWTGATSTNWATTTNWSTGSVPTTANYVLIPGSLSNYPVIGTSVGASCNNLTISNGASLRIESTIDGTGSLIIEGTLTNNGTMTAQRYITGSSNDWHLLSSPVSAQEISGNFTDANGYDFYLYNEPTVEWINRKNLSGGSGVAPYFDVINGDLYFTPGKGYLVAYTDPNANAKSFSGTFNQGNQSIILTKTDGVSSSGANLVGNPYPSSIDWKAASGWTRDMLVDDDEGAGTGYTMYIWNEASHNYGAFISNGSSGSLGVTQYIPPMQGFFVNAASAGLLQMTNAVRTHSGADNWMKQQETTPTVLKMQVIHPDLGRDEAIVEFSDTHSGGAPKWQSLEPTAPSLWISEAQKDYSILFSPETRTEPLALHFQAGNEGTYNLSVEADNQQFNQLILEDLQLGLTQDLLKNNQYTFTADPSDASARFNIHFSVVGLEENPIKDEVLVWKQNNLLYLKGAENYREAGLFDLQGRLLQRTTLSGDDLQSMPSPGKTGMYLIRLLGENHTVSKKLIIK